MAAVVRSLGRVPCEQPMCELSERATLTAMVHWGDSVAVFGMVAMGYEARALAASPLSL